MQVELEAAGRNLVARNQALSLQVGKLDENFACWVLHLELLEDRGTVVGDGHISDVVDKHLIEADWAKKAIMANGNYGEIFEKTIGENTPIGLSRGLNAQWTEGGLMYSPPFR